MSVNRAPIFRGLFFKYDFIESVAVMSYQPVVCYHGTCDVARGPLWQYINYGTVTNDYPTIDTVPIPACHRQLDGGVSHSGHQ